MGKRHATLVGLALSTIPTVSIAPAHAHSWYPRECCSGQDCKPADGLEIDARGGKVVVVGHHRIRIPSGFPVRSSPDTRIHICYRHVSWPEEGAFTMPFCVFLPSQS
jgi:hypothetical protein